MAEVHVHPTAYSCAITQAAPRRLHVRGHGTEGVAPMQLQLTDGFCQCGCGQPVENYRTTDHRWGQIKGQPRKFLQGHNLRKSPVDWVAEDRGYDTPCWIWQLYIDAGGYGIKYYDGRSRVAHKVLYEAKYGPVPDGLELDHLCRNRACCNPDHLETVTRAVNIRRGDKTKLTPDDVRMVRASDASAAELAVELGVAKCTIYDIRSGRSWSDIG